MRILISFLALVVIIGCLSYLEHQDLQNDSSYSTIYSETDEFEALGSTEDTTSESIATYSLEWVLEGTKMVDGYMVDTYREYEIYVDENGEVTNEVPTSNFNYIKYEQ